MNSQCWSSLLYWDVVDGWSDGKFTIVIPGNIIPTLYEGYIVSVHRMVMENRPVDPCSIQGSHRPISFIRIKHRIRADDILCKAEY